MQNWEVRQGRLAGPIHSNRHLMMMKRIARLGLGAVLAGGLVACGEPEGGTTLEPAFATSSNPTLVECPSDESYETSATILPTGGSVELRGHSIQLPLGAVVTATTIGLREPASQYMLIAATADGQDHFQFLEPVAVTISYARCTRNNLEKGPLSVWLVDPATGALLENMGGVDDKENRTVTFQTDHFSGYAIAN